MTSHDLIALLPMLVQAGAIVLVLLAIPFIRVRQAAFILTLVGLTGAFATLWPALSEAPRLVTPLIVIDRYAIFFMGLVIAATGATVILAQDYLAGKAKEAGEFYLLLLIACLGASVLVASSHFASFFLGLELLSVSLYALIAYEPRNDLGTEAAIKYLVLAGASSAFLLFGMALAYAATGTLQLPGLIKIPVSPVALAGIGLMLVGFGFKLAVVPFHLWTPDVYQGAPPPVAALIATVSKSAVFAFLLRNSGTLLQSRSLIVVLVCISMASMLAGALLALRQTNVKRILAYSSITHLGYLLVAFVAGGPHAAGAIAFYLVAYCITMLGAFGCISVLSPAGTNAGELSSYLGLAWRQPWLALTFSAMLLSLAGIPLTAGFVSKFYVMAAGAATGLWWMLIVLALSSVIGMYYYLRILFVLYRDLEAPRQRISISGSLVLCILTLLLVWLGVFPAPLLEIIRAM